MRAALYNLSVATLLLAAIFVPLERCFAARRQAHLRPGFGVDASYFVFQYLAMAGVLLAFNAAVQQWFGPIAGTTVVHSIRRLPLVAQAALALLLGDFLLYWAHRASHQVPWLWRFHAVHHSVTQLDWVAAHREHPLDGLYSQVWLNLPAVLLGVQLEALGPLLVLRGFWAVFVHSNVTIPLGPLGVLLGDPVLHRWHHARVARTRHNFANLAPYLDVLFGTHHRPENETFEIGLAEPLPPSGHLLGQAADDGRGESVRGDSPSP